MSDVFRGMLPRTAFTDPSFGFFGFLGLSAPVFNLSHSERVIGKS